MGHASSLAVKLLIRPAPPAWAGPVTAIGQVVSEDTQTGASLDKSHNHDHQDQSSQSRYTDPAGRHSTIGANFSTLLNAGCRRGRSCDSGR
jgi:hypothetical protein